MRLYDKRPPHDVAHDLVRRRIDKARFWISKADFGLEPDEKYSDHFELEPIAEKTSSMATDREYRNLQWGVRVNGRPAGRVRSNYTGDRHKFVPGWYKDEDVYDPAVHGEPYQHEGSLVAHFASPSKIVMTPVPPNSIQNTSIREDSRRVIAAGPVQQLKLFHQPHEPRGLANPLGGHQWFHGSPHRFSEFADPATHHPLMFEQDPDDTTHWNSLLGTHFAADRSVAHSFSKGEHENTGSDAFTDHFNYGDEEPSQHIVHARLDIRRPKHYESEHDMDQEVYEHEWKAGNHPEKHLIGENDEDDYEGEPGEQTLHHYGGHDDRMRTKSDADPIYFHRAREYHPYATGWLNHHPEKYEIAQRFRQRLEKQGYDGITYGNEFEQSDVDHPESSMSAIAFHPHQITIQRHFRGNQPDPGMAHEGATAGLVSRLATPLPAGVHYEDMHTAAYGDPYERGQGPYMPEPDDEHLRDHLADRHKLDPEHWRFGDIKHWRRWHNSEHAHLAHETHQHSIPRGEPLEEKYPAVYEIDPDTDIFGGQAQHPWDRGKGLPPTGEFIPREMRYRSSLVEHMAAWVPSAGIFGPTTGLDQDLFEGDQLRPQVRQAVFEKLDEALRVDGGVAGSDWQDWARVYLAGGSASEWAGQRPGDQGARDLDILIGLNYSRARQQLSSSVVGDLPGSGRDDAADDLTDPELDARLNRALREHFNDKAWHPAFGGTWSLTGYVNPHAWDITVLRPYAAYDLTDMRWAVRPPHLPGHSAADFPQALLAQARAVASEARAVLRLPEPFRTQQARAMWERLHAERRRAFSIEGEGWVDPGNVIEKFLAYSRGHILEKIRELALAR